MNKLFIALIAAVSLTAGMADSAQACYRGAARRAACCQTYCCPVAQQCCTVMKTCQKVVYQQKQYTCYRTCYEPVWEQKTVTATRYVPETRYRQCVETVCRPVYETAEREVCYTVCKPVKEMRTVQVCSGHWEMQNVETCMPNACDPCAPAAEDGEAMPRMEAGDDREASRVREVRAANRHEESAIHGMQDGDRSAHPPGAVHGVQARAVSDDGELRALRGEAGSVHGDALRAAGGDGASPGQSMLPRAFVLRKLKTGRQIVGGVSRRRLSAVQRRKSATTANRRRESPPTIPIPGYPRS